MLFWKKWKASRWKQNAAFKKKLVSLAQWRVTETWLVLIQRVLEIRLSIIAIPSFRIWGNFPSFRLLGFGAIFRHSVFYGRPTGLGKKKILRRPHSPLRKFLSLWPSHPPGISNPFRGGGMDIFWNYTFWLFINNQFSILVIQQITIFSILVIYK